MMKKSLLLIAILSFGFVGLANASTKKFEISLTARSKAGTAELAPGVYKVLVDGDKATFTDAKNKSVTVTVKLTTGKSKFAATAVEASQKSGEDEIDAIDLGGTNTKVEFTY
jgi:hypothetical protein